MITHDTDDQRVEELLAPLADIPAVPHRERRVAAHRTWLRPVLVGAACLTALVAAGTAIVTTGGGGTLQPAVTSPAPAPLPTVPDLGVWFVRGGELVRVAVPDTAGGVDAPRRALEAVLAVPPAGYETEVVPGTRLESFSVADAIATIKLSGRTPVDRGLEQIVATLTDFDDVSWVRFGVEEGLVDRTLAAGAVDAAPAIELVRAEANADGTAISFAGTADTFEANVQLRVVQGGTVLASTFVTATCGTGCRGSFEGTIDVPTRAGNVRLEAFTTSAEDGSERDVVGRDVTIAP